jgi:cobalamin synthase
MSMEFELFPWWVASISFSIVFLTLVSIYLYRSRNHETTEDKGKTRANDIAVSFVFVWILIGLLFFYILSVRIGSALVFAIGNIAVEVILLAYLLKNKAERSEKTG